MRIIKRINANTNDKKIIYKEKSYRIVGVLFDVYNELGSGYQEKIVERAIALRLEKLKIPFKRQLPTKLFFENEEIGKYYLDFLIYDKIVLEIKVCNRFYARHIRQVNEYLKIFNKRLGILALFSTHGVKIKRILNPEYKDFKCESDANRFANIRK